jgi:4-aminobutyrate aminotransferase
MIGVELVEPGTNRPDSHGAAEVMEQARKRGLLVGKGGMYGNVLRIAPPLSLTEAEADEGYVILEAAVDAAGQI